MVMRARPHDGREGMRHEGGHGSHPTVPAIVGISASDLRLASLARSGIEHARQRRYPRSLHGYADRSLYHETVGATLATMPTCLCFSALRGMILCAGHVVAEISLAFRQEHQVSVSSHC